MRPLPSADPAFEFDLKSPVAIMGILNITPDSFWPASRLSSAEAAVAQAERFAEQGADLLDVGGESSRPGFQGISLQEELDRVLPVVEALARNCPLPISIDTTKPEVAQAALEAGASMVNDISGLRDPEMAQVAVQAQVPVVVMHMQGTPRTMQQNPQYKDCVSEILEFFKERLAFCQSRGISQIILDPGIGFGKTIQHNWEILRSLRSFVDLGYPVLLGTSRKSFLAELGPGRKSLPAQERLEATLASCVWAVSQGVRLLRVHDVEATRRAVAFMEALWKS